MGRNFKKLKIVGYFSAVILMLFLFAYDNYFTNNRSKNNFTVNNYLANPKEYGGLQLEALGVIGNISENYFYFDMGGRSIKVFGSGIKRPVLGETLVFLDYRKDGVIKLIDYHNYNFNYVLYAVSFLSVIIFILIFFKEWKITLRGFKSD